MLTGTATIKKQIVATATIKKRVSATAQIIAKAPTEKQVRIIASENIAAGDFVNVNNGFMRKANATDATKPADGFVRYAVANGELGTMFTIGSVNDMLSGLTGEHYWLSTTAGEVTDDVSTYGGGNIIQRLGKKISSTKLLFENQDYEELS